MTSAGQIGITLGVLVLVAGGSLIGWIVTFRRADRTERQVARAESSRPERS